MKSKGFTLIELLVVVAIIGILATVVLASLGSARSRARDAKRISELKQVQNALELYYLDFGYYPPQVGAPNGCGDAASWADPLAPLVSGGYLASLPIDPVNSTPTCYNYSNVGPNSVWTCNGISRSNHDYVLFFGLENTNTSVLNASTGLMNKCLPGPLL